MGTVCKNGPFRLDSRLIEQNVPPGPGVYALGAVKHGEFEPVLTRCVDTSLKHRLQDHYEDRFRESKTLYPSSTRAYERREFRDARGRITHFEFEDIANPSQRFVTACKLFHEHPTALTPHNHHPRPSVRDDVCPICVPGREDLEREVKRPLSQAEYFQIMTTTLAASSPTVCRHGPFQISKPNIARILLPKPGVYVLGIEKNSSFLSVYVGRSGNLQSRLRQHIHRPEPSVGDCSLFEFEYAADARAAFRAECAIYHRHWPRGNRRHPGRDALPRGTACPECGYGLDLEQLVRAFKEPPCRWPWWLLEKEPYHQIHWAMPPKAALEAECGRAISWGDYYDAALALKTHRPNQIKWEVSHGQRVRLKEVRFAVSRSWWRTQSEHSIPPFIPQPPVGTTMDPLWTDISVQVIRERARMPTERVYGYVTVLCTPNASSDD